MTEQELLDWLKNEVKNKTLIDAHAKASRARKNAVWDNFADVTYNMLYDSSTEGAKKEIESKYNEKIKEKFLAWAKSTDITTFPSGDFKEFRKKSISQKGKDGKFVSVDPNPAPKPVKKVDPAEGAITKEQRRAAKGLQPLPPPSSTTASTPSTSTASSSSSTSMFGGRKTETWRNDKNIDWSKMSEDEILDKDFEENALKNPNTKAKIEKILAHYNSTLFKRAMFKMFGSHAIKNIKSEYKNKVIWDDSKKSNVRTYAPFNDFLDKMLGDIEEKNNPQVTPSTVAATASPVAEVTKKTKTQQTNTEFKGAVRDREKEKMEKENHRLLRVIARNTNQLSFLRSFLLSLPLVGGVLSKGIGAARAAGNFAGSIFPFAAAAGAWNSNKEGNVFGDMFNGLMPDKWKEKIQEMAPKNEMIRSFGNHLLIGAGATSALMGGTGEMAKNPLAAMASTLGIAIASAIVKNFDKIEEKFNLFVSVMEKIDAGISGISAILGRIGEKFGVTSKVDSRKVTSTEDKKNVAALQDNSRYQYIDKDGKSHSLLGSQIKERVLSDAPLVDNKDIQSMKNDEQEFYTKNFSAFSPSTWFISVNEIRRKMFENSILSKLPSVSSGNFNATPPMFAGVNWSVADSFNGANDATRGPETVSALGGAVQYNVQRGKYNPFIEQLRRKEGLPSVSPVIVNQQFFGNAQGNPSQNGGSGQIISGVGGSTPTRDPMTWKLHGLYIDPFPGN